MPRQRLKVWLCQSRHVTRQTTACGLNKHSLVGSRVPACFLGVCFLGVMLSVIDHIIWHMPRPLGSQLLAQFAPLC
jgi:hypothetical protein